MNYNNATSVYRESVIRSANQVELVIMMYDMIIEDVRQSIEAIGSNDVLRRTESMKHAMSVLEQLQGTLNMEGGGEAARNLDAFYSIARAKLLEAHIKCSAELMRSQQNLFVDLRAAWKQVASHANADAIEELERTSTIPAAVTQPPAEPGSAREWMA